MGKAIETLETIVEEQAIKITELEQTMRWYKNSEAWMCHRFIDEENVSKQFIGYKTLPFPRLEMQINPLRDDWYEVEWIYGIVYKHYDESIIWIPMGRTTGKGGYKKYLKPLSILPPQFKYPSRDGLNIRVEMRLFNLRGFLLCDGQIEEIDKGNDLYPPELFIDAMKELKRE